MGMIHASLLRLGRAGRAIVAPLLVACLAATPPVPAKEHVVAPAEILAIQALVAEVAAPGPHANIADFQRELAREDRAPLQADSDHSGTPGNALTPVSLRLMMESLHAHMPAAFAVPRPRCLGPRMPFLLPAIAPWSKVERFRMNLTPHAPPIAMMSIHHS